MSSRPLKTSVPAEPTTPLHNIIEREHLKSGKRINTAVKKLQSKGIIDAQGRSISKELPPDMRDESKCTLG